MTVEAEVPEPGSPPYPGNIKADPVAFDLWLQQWYQSEAGKSYLQQRKDYAAAKRTSPRFRASVARDGSFRIDDVPPGDYRLSYLSRGGRNPEAVNGSLTTAFSVDDKIDQGGKDEVNLGSLQLE